MFQKQATLKIISSRDVIGIVDIVQSTMHGKHKRVFLSYSFILSIFGDCAPPQWMACGTSGPAGVPVPPPAPMGPRREPESVTAPLTEARNAEESG